MNIIIIVERCKHQAEGLHGEEILLFTTCRLIASLKVFAVRSDEPVKNLEYIKVILKKCNNKVIASSPTQHPPTTFVSTFPSSKWCDNMNSSNMTVHTQ